MTTAHLASIPNRELLLKIVLESVRPYVDCIFVALNGYSHDPPYANEFPTATFRHFDNRFGDAHKFEFMGEVDGLCYVLDDDLQYSAEFFALLQRKELQYKCPVSLHGKKYLPNPRGFRYFKENYRCLGSVRGDHGVDIIGTGVMAFHTETIRPSMADFELPNMADIFFSRLCHGRGIPLMVVEHRAGIVKYLHPPTTIWQMTRNFQLHDKIIKEFL
jgi:hypothetical protein